MHKQLLFPAFLALLPLAAHAQVGIGTPAPDARAALEIKATDKGLLIPRLTAGQRTGLTSVPQGLLVYQTDGSASGGTDTGFWYYGGAGGWVFLNTSAGSGLSLPFSSSYGGAAATPALDVSHTNGGTALRGAAAGAGLGVAGSSDTGSGVYGSSNANSASVGGVLGVGNGGSNGVGVLGTSQSGFGVRGEASGAGRAAYFTKTGTTSGAVVEIRQASGVTDPALIVQGNTQMEEANTLATGTANLLPAAYGRISRTGAILGGTGNFTVVQTLPSYGVYVITINNLSAVDLTNAACQVTCRYGVPGQPNAQFVATANGQPNGKVEVHIANLTTPSDLSEADFTFVIFRP